MFASYFGKPLNQAPEGICATVFGTFDERKRWQLVQCTISYGLRYGYLIGHACSLFNGDKKRKKVFWNI